MGDEIDTIYSFGECRFSPKIGELKRSDDVTSLSAKATALLTFLLEKNGDYVSKAEIFEKIWPDTFVEDGVLTQNIYTLRKAIGNDVNGRPIIENKPRLGYRIAVPIESNDTIGGDRKAVPAASGFSYWYGFAIGCVVLVVLMTSVFAYQFIFPEAVVTISRLERIKIQKVTDTADITFPTISPDGNFVAYKRNASIFVKDLSNLTESKVEITNVDRLGAMEFSNDGASLYLRNRASYFLPANIMKVSRFGGVAEKIASNVWSNGFSFSPDGRQLAFIRSFPNENRQALILKNLDNDSETELSSVSSPEELRIRSFPVFSSDGAKVAVIIDRQNQVFGRIMILDLLKKTSENISYKNLAQVEQIRWLPGKNTLIASAREGKFYQLWEMSIADQKLNRITNDLNNYVSISLSLDGKKLLTTKYSFNTTIWMAEGSTFENEKQLTFGNSNRDGFSGLSALPNGEVIYSSNEAESGAFDLFRLDPISGKRQRLTQNAGEFNRFPVVSPDGVTIYFESNRSGRPAIWHINANGEDPKQVTSTEKAADIFPQLSPDGMTLYFIRRIGKESAVYSRSLSTGQEIQLTEPNKWSPANFLSLSPDGRLLGFQDLTENIRSDDTTQAHQIAVLDTTDPRNIRSFNIGGRLPRIYWTADSMAFDYVIPVGDVDEVRRQLMNAGLQPETIKSFSKDRIWFISRLSSEKAFMSRGLQENDAVLITNFE